MKRTLALLLSVVLTVAAALPVMAYDHVQTAPETASSAADPGAGAPLSASSGASAAAGSETTGEPAPDAPASAGPEDAATSSDVNVLTANSIHNTALVADNTADTLHFENLRKALEKYNYTVLSLQGQMKDISNTTTADVWDMIVPLGQMKSGVSEAKNSVPINTPLWTALYTEEALLSSQIGALQAQRDSMNDSTESAKNSLNDAINQIVKGAETLYIAIVTMEDGLDAMNRGLETLDRAVAITEKRQELGMASAYDVESIHHQRSQLQSQIDSLKFQISSNKVTLEGMCGMELSGSVKLAALPIPTQADLDAVSYDKMLSTAMDRNVDVANAQISYSTKDSGANKNALSGAKNTFAAKFKVVCITIPEDSRLVTAAQGTVDFQQRTFNIAAKKYELGMLSHEEYLSAKSDLDSAQDDLKTAQRNLFSAYRAYVNATQYGLV
ncbi:TolC family protein [Oscillibacter sp.]|uniref:TolC family protein n=1 Tax=Oscillibacter sp. TaxID=1945593 RepID=UPI0033933DAD